MHVHVKDIIACSALIAHSLRKKSLIGITLPGLYSYVEGRSLPCINLRYTVVCHLYTALIPKFTSHLK